MHANRKRAVYDVAVIGLGIMGSAALSFLSRQGKAVIGFDQFPLPHSFGSSHGETRLVRMAYDKGEMYVPLMQDAVRSWRQLEERRGTQIFFQSGVVYIGSKNSELLSGVRASAQCYGLTIKDDLCVESPELRQFSNLDEKTSGIFEPSGGYLRSDVAWSSFLAEADTNGAAIASATHVKNVFYRGGAFNIRTSVGDYTASGIVLTCGPWITDFFPELASLVRVQRQVLNWHADPRGQYSEQRGFLPFVHHTKHRRIVYGFPSFNSDGMKIAEHTVGQETSHPAALDRNSTYRDRRYIQKYAKKLFPEIGPWQQSKVCMYTMSPDEHFVIDSHPEFDRMWYMTGESGHAFKFAPVIGEILAQGALGLGRSPLVDLFSFDRFKRRAPSISAGAVNALA